MNSLSECNWRLPSSGCSVYVNLTDPSTRAGEGLADRAALSLRDHELFASLRILTADLLTDNLAFITYTQSARLWLPNLIFWIILITIFTAFRFLCSKMTMKTSINIYSIRHVLPNMHKYYIHIYHIIILFCEVTQVRLVCQLYFYVNYSGNCLYKFNPPAEVSLASLIICSKANEPVMMFMLSF